MAPGNAQPVGKAVIVYGTVKAVSASGYERILTPNSVIYANERIVTGPDGSVSIAFTNNPSPMILGRISDVLIDEDVYGAADAGSAGDSATLAMDIQTALEQDPNFDPTTDLPPPAAGAGVTGAGPKGGGRQIVIFEATQMEVTPDSGAETRGIAWDFLDPPYGVLPEEDVPAGGDVVEAPAGSDVVDLNDPPVAVSDPYTMPEDGEPIVLNPLAGDSDSDGGTLTVVSINGTLLIPGTAQTIAVMGGEVNISAEGVITFTPETNFNGTVSFPYTISDGQGGTATANQVITVEPVNDPPVAVSDSYTMKEGGNPITLNPLVDDSDPDSDPLTVTSINNIALTPGVAQTILVTGGTVNVSDSGEITFTPTSNFNGTVSFPYEISDGQGAVSTANQVITVEPMNDPPVAVTDKYTMDEDTAPIILNPLAGDSDIDGDSLIVTRINGTLLTPGTAQTIAVTDGTVHVNAEGVITFTPAPNFIGEVQFSYIISDGQGGTATANQVITVNAVNDPITDGDESVTVTEDVTLTVPAATGLLANTVDVDGNTPSVTGFTVSGTAYEVTAGTPGVATLGGIGTLTINSDGSYSFVPAANYTGLIPEVSYTVTSGGDTDTSTLVITVDPVNDPPVALNDNLTGTEDAARTITATELFGADGTGGVNDFDIDSASFTSITITEQGAHGTLQLKGINVTVNQVISVADITNGHLRFVPDQDFSGETTFKYTVSDGALSSNEATVTIDFAPVVDMPEAYPVFGTPKFISTTIDNSNVTRTDLGFTVKAYGIDGTEGSVAIRSSGTPEGFGVAGKASGNDMELGQTGIRGMSERMTVTFDNPVSEARLSFAWLARNELAQYKLLDANGDNIGGAIVRGITDNIDPLPVPLRGNGGALIKTIEFTAPTDGGDNDYLINEINFVTGTVYPVNLTVEPKDIDFSETVVSIGLAIPNGASLSNGTRNSDGTWTLPLISSGSSYTVTIDPVTHAVDITGLQMTVPGSTSTQPDISMIVTVEDNAGGGLADTKTFIIGTESANTMTGGTGEDTLIGRGGNDTLNGGAGNDVLIGGTGADHIDGGDSSDTVSYSGSSAGVVVNIADAAPEIGGDAQGDTLTNVENIIGSAHNDTLTGNESNNILDGAAGNDTLAGGGGIDTLIGGSGNDTLTGGSGADTFKVGEGNDTITDYIKGEGDIVDISDVLNSAEGDHSRLGVVDVDGKAQLVIYEDASKTTASDSVTFNIDYGLLDGSDPLNSLLDQVNIDHTK